MLLPYPVWFHLDSTTQHCAQQWSNYQQPFHNVNFVCILNLQLGLNSLRGTGGRGRENGFIHTPKVSRATFTRPNHILDILRSCGAGVCVADVCCCSCHTSRSDKHWPNKHNTSNMRAVDKPIVHTLIADHTWLLPSPNGASFIQYFFMCVHARLCTYHTACVSVSIHLVSVLSPVTLSQDNPVLC